MKKLLLKVCGMRNPENILDLVALQPDFIGFIFHKKSPRNITDNITVSLPENIKKVGVFVNKSQDFITKINESYSLDYLQLHGNESSDFCKKMKQKGFQVIKAFNVSENFDFKSLDVYEANCDYFLFDAFGKNEGGNGITFNWDLLKQYNGKIPFMLSGGIDATMASAIKNFQHDKLIGIDINSKFEISPAFKNIELIKTFTNEL